MVHIVPMNWTDYKPGQTVQVWTYANEPTVELFLNGQSLGAKSFTRKTTTFGQSYLETTECPGDDKNYTGGACPGSYESPNGSSGKLHLTWNVPFEPGRLTAVAKDANGHVVAKDEVDTAGHPDQIHLTTDRTQLLADGKSLAYVTVHVDDAHGDPGPGRRQHRARLGHRRRKLRGRGQRQAGRRRGLQVDHPRRVQRTDARDRAGRDAARPDPCQRDLTGPDRRRAHPPGHRSPARRRHRDRAPTRAQPRRPAAQPARARPRTPASPAACSAATARTSA